ncbi:MAG: TonB-dependent receptor, partial [Blastocatellia bacterium]|nr:TonB-dependent receptor [Blastocatellia bacterium]
MTRIRNRHFQSAVLCLALIYGGAAAQNISASLNGVITDENGGAITKATVTLISIGTGIEMKASTDSGGYYGFLNLPAGDYELKITANGFQSYARSGIRIALNEKVRLDAQLKVGAMTEIVQVKAEASQINREDATQSGSVEPKTVADLPLIVAGSFRSAATFATLLPGAVTPDGDIFKAHFNGGMLHGGEAILNGVTMVNPSGGGAVSSASFDFAQSPDMVSELKLLNANYEPQYGSTGAMVIIMETKAGTNQFHGNLYEYNRNTVLNANQFGIGEGRLDRPKDIQNNFGGSIGGPVKLPFAWSSRNKTFFFANWEGYRVRGGVVRSVLSIPSLKERQGDFSDWVDPEGNLIPIYDPATTRVVNGQIVRDQFMGCDGKTPNVICQNDPRLKNSLALQWLKLLPDPTSPGTTKNFSPPALPGGYSADADILNLRFDQYLGEKDHITVTIYKRNNLPQDTTYLPPQLSTGQINYKRTWVNRVSWDRNFSPTLLNHFGLGYNHDHFYGGGIDVPYTDQLPKIKGVARNAYPPAIRFLDDGFEGYGSDQGSAEENSWPAPAVTGNDLLTWVKGKHTLKFGVEYRNMVNNVPYVTGEAGEFRFSRLNTGLLDVNSGSPIASFLLEQVDNATFSIRNTTRAITIQTAWIAHAGDTWRVTPKLSLNYGLRWETFSPSYEKHDFFSFLDPAGPNPGAGNRPGRLAFASDEAGAASFGRRYPEERYYKAFSPRIGVAYSPNEKTVVRLGYGIFIDAGYVPGWGGGVGLDGYNANPSFSSSQGGLVAAFTLSDGPPQNFARPPFLDATFLNGQNAPTYRPIDANRLPYSQQWNLTIEHQATRSTSVSVAYVGSKGTRLISRVQPINALNPKLLAQYGRQLYDEFAPGQASLHGVPIPYAGWVEQMQACPPSLAQALLPFPQYCGNIYGVNENVGNSTYHSLQLKAEKRFSQGLWLLSTYTFSKLLTNADDQQPNTLGVSPFDQKGTKGLAFNDVPHTFSLAMIYDLPFGKGQRWLNRGGVIGRLVGGWKISNILRFNSWTPFTFSSSFCNVPGQFAMSCIPGVLPGQNPWAQDKSNFDPSKPLFNIAAFEPASAFESPAYYGGGSRITTYRGFGYHNHDFALTKDIQITERVNFQLRAEAFNLWNNHTLTGFNTDIASGS